MSTLMSSRSECRNDGLVPLQPLDIMACATVDELVRAMGRTALVARQIGEAADVLCEMLLDPECFIVGSFSGVMTVAKLGLLLAEMVERRMLHVIVATGALIGHGLIESVGHQHFKYDGDMDDATLHRAGYDRIYDTLELENNFGAARDFMLEVLDTFTPGTTLSSHYILTAVGERLQQYSGRGFLKSAYERNVRVFVPAFTDSELGLSLAVHRMKARRDGAEPLRFDPYCDIEAYCELIRNRRTLGIVTIGGGVPRNWAQQIAPYLEILHTVYPGDFTPLRFKYAVRVCPEPAHWGGASGATYEEGVSWGKILPKSEGGRWAEVYSDATVAWPLIVRSAIDRVGLGAREVSR